MLNRRLFVKSALATNAGVLAASSQAFQLAITDTQGSPLLVFADDKAPTSSSFIASVTGKVSGIGPDVGQHFDVLSTFCRESPSGRVVGLTRSSDFFVLEQVAKDFGFYARYSASHRHTGNIIAHEVSASAGAAEHIASSLKDAGEHWPQWLAGNIGTLSHGHSQSTTVINQVVVPNVARQEFLVSWILSA